MHPLSKLIKIHNPRLWFKCNPKHFVGADNHCPLSVPATVLANSIGHIYELGVEHVSRPVKSHYLAGIRLIQNCVPTYHVASSLLRAISRTMPPEDLDFRDIPMPYQSVLFLLPNGVLCHPDDGNFGYILVGRARDQEVLLNSNDILKPPVGFGGLRQKGDQFEVTSGTLTKSDMHIYSFGLTNEDSLKTIFSIDREQANKDNHWFRDDGEVVHVDITDNDIDFNRRLILLAVQLLLVMDARPDLVEHGGPTGKTTKNGVQICKPSWVGRNYRIRTRGHTHASPNLHWRRGHYRRQPYGPERTLRKTIWLEPTLVGS